MTGILDCPAALELPDSMAPLEIPDLLAKKETVECRETQALEFPAFPVTLESMEILGSLASLEPPVCKALMDKREKQVQMVLLALREV